MLKLRYDNSKKLIPIEKRREIDVFLKSFSEYSWLKPSKDLTRSEIETQVNLVLIEFGVKAKIEIKRIETRKDWEKATEAKFTKQWLKAWDKQWDSIVKVIGEEGLGDAQELVWFAAKNNSWQTASKSAWLTNWTSAWIAGIASLELMIDKQAGFTELLKLWQMGVFPVGMLEDTKKFTVYVPFSSLEFPNI